MSGVGTTTGKELSLCTTVATVFESVNELATRRLPLLRGGVAATFKKMSRYLSQGAAGEVRI
jgi:hypothetical protein